MPWDFGQPMNLLEATDILRGSVFTDRGVYKQGEEVHIKAIVRADTPNGVRLLKSGSTLELRSPLALVPPDADSFYIHDVAVASRCRGRGVGRILAGRLVDLARARGFRRSELVSVQGSAPFWAGLGFREIERFDYAPGAPSLKMACDL